MKRKGKTLRKPDVFLLDRLEREISEAGDELDEPFRDQPEQTPWGARGDRIGPRYLNYHTASVDFALGDQVTVPYLHRDGRARMVCWTVTDKANTTSRHDAAHIRLELDGVVV